MLNILKTDLTFTKIYHSYLKRKKKKWKKVICSIENKEIYVVCIRALKQALNHGLKLKRMRRVIQFNQRHG